MRARMHLRATLGAALLVAASAPAAVAGEPATASAAENTLEINHVTLQPGGDSVDVNLTYSCRDGVFGLYTSWSFDQSEWTTVTGFSQLYARDGDITCDGTKRTIDVVTNRLTDSGRPLTDGDVLEVKSKLHNGDGAPHVSDVSDEEI